MTFLIDIKYEVLLRSINGVNKQIAKRRDYVNVVTSQVRKNQYFPNQIKKALTLRKEFDRLKIIRNELWMIILKSEISELIISSPTKK